MPLTSAAVMGGVSLVSGMMGSSAAAADKAKADAARQAAINRFLAIDVPDLQEQKLILQRYQSTGQLSPELEKAFQQSQSEVGKINLDPSTRAAQVSALQKMSSIADQGGMDAQARQANQQAISSANTNEKGQRDAIVQNYAQRGMGGSGAELQASLLASQGDANQAASQGLQASSAAQQRALQAMASGASLAGNINQADYQQKSDAVKAQDMINQFNTRNSQSVANSNVDIQNQAQGKNLAANQAVANANTGVANQEEMANKGLYQQQFQNNMQVAQGAAGGDQQQAAQSNSNASQKANQWAGIGSAINQGVAAYGQKKNNQDDSEE